MKKLMVEKHTRVLSPELDREFHAKIDEVKGYAVEQKDKAADIIKEHPFLAVGGALLGGVILGMLLTRTRD